MNKSKRLIISLITAIICVFSCQNIYAQKLEIDRKTGDTTLTHLIITSQQGHWGTNFYYIHFQKQKDDFKLRLIIKKDESNQFFIAEDKPMEFVLASNDTLKFYSTAIVESKMDVDISGFGLLDIFDKESSLNYNITYDDIIKMRDNDYMWVKIYYHSQLDRKMVGTYEDENGYYFRLKHAKKDRKRKNRKKTEHIQEFLDAL